MNRLILLASSLVVALSLVGCRDLEAQKQAKATQAIISDPTQVVTVVTANPSPVAETLEITGEVTSGLDAEVGAKQSGKLIAVFVKDGDAVAAGQLLASQDTSVQQAQLRQAIAGLSSANSQLSQAIANAKIGPSKSAAAVAQAQAQVKSAQASLAKVKAGARSEERVQMEWTVKQAKANLDTAKQDLDRKQKLLDQGAIPQSQLDQAENTYASALSQYNTAIQNQAIQTEGARPEDLAVARESVKSAQEQLAQAKAQQKLDVLYNDQVSAAQAAVQSARAQVDVVKQTLSDAEIRAPFTGKVAGKPAQPGQIVGPGTTVARIIGAGGAYFEGDVPETEITKVQTGRPVSISLSAIPNKVFSGHIAAINPVGSDVGRLFTVRVTFDAISPEIKPGMFARGIITLSTIPNAIMIPSTAVVPYQNHPVVFVLNGKDGVKSVPVVTGLRKGDDVQIVTGLAGGERVVVRGQENLNDKSKVRIETTVAAGLQPTSGGS